MDPDDDIPEGRIVASKIIQEKKLSKNAVEHIITYFDNVSAAHRYLSPAAANLSSLGKLVDAETFKMVLCVGIWPLVQLNILDKFLDPIKDPEVNTSTESICKKIAQDLLYTETRSCCLSSGARQWSYEAVV